MDHMQPAPGLQQLKEKMRGSWMAGDFGQIARYAAPHAEAFVDALPIRPGMQVLDVACGTGNLAIPQPAGAHTSLASISRRIWSHKRG